MCDKHNKKCKNDKLDSGFRVKSKHAFWITMGKEGRGKGVCILHPNYFRMNNN